MVEQVACYLNANTAKFSVEIEEETAQSALKLDFRVSFDEIVLDNEVAAASQSNHPLQFS